MNSYNNIPELAQFNFPDVERSSILIFCPGLAMRKAGDFLQMPNTIHPYMYGFPMGQIVHASPRKKCCGEFMSTKCLPKNRRERLGRKGVCVLPEYGVYQNVYQGHFMPREMGFPGAFLRLLGTFLGGVRGVILCYRVACSAQWQSMILQVQKHSRRNTP